MKKTFILTAFVLLTAIPVFSQTQFEVSTDAKSGDKVMKGIISRSLLEKEPSFTWYAEAQKLYSPNEAAVAALKKNTDSIQLLVFMGTWCEDSHFVIPRFFSLLDKSGFPNDKVTLIGVDRDKKTLSHLSEAMNVTNVPTIIVMKNGKELGRVIEYGNDGLFDKALGEILAGK
ncbi:MAG: thioredoxin family protein [Chitinophagaceae bacterium]